MGWKANPNVVSDRLGETLVLVNLATDRILELNQTAAALFDMVASGLREDVMAEMLASEYEVEPEVARREISGLLGSLAKEQVVIADAD